MLHHFVTPGRVQRKYRIALRTKTSLLDRESFCNIDPFKRVPTKVASLAMETVVLEIVNAPIAQSRLAGAAQRGKSTENRRRTAMV